MGSSASAVSAYNGNINATIMALMPVYYLPDSVTHADAEIVRKTWKIIQSNDVPGKNIMVSITGSGPDTNSSTLFKLLYFKRLFDVHPLSKPLFSAQAVASGRFIGVLIDMCWRQLEDEKEFRRRAVEIARDHCSRGIKAVEYGIVGEVLLWSVSIALGSTLFTFDVERAWVKVFSSLLTIMVPIAVATEIESSPECDHLYQSHREVSRKRSELYSTEIYSSDKTLSIVKQKEPPLS
jgi:hemoglobin-like flavoprotein